MPRTYYSDKAVPLRPLPKLVRPSAPLTRKEAIARLEESLGSIGTDWKPMHSLKSAATLLTDALGPGWSESELRQLTRNGSLSQGTHWFKRGGRYAVDIVAIAEWYFNQQETHGT